ncbi:MAG TPA: hypothetical protein VFT99_04760 [Roseiflexaceae bacterium]|nr:hypothetical protein [Roseiflexaceae bacterium]
MTVMHPTTLYACLRCQHAATSADGLKAHLWRRHGIDADGIRPSPCSPRPERFGVILIDAACWFVGGRPVAYVEQQVEP